MVRYLHRHGEFIVIACIFIFGLSLLLATDNIIKISAERAAQESAGPKFWPLLVLSALTILSAFLLIKSIIEKRKTEVDKEKEEEYIKQFSNTRLIGLIGGLFLYLFAMQYIGFTLSTIFFLLFVCKLIKMPLLKNAVFSFFSLAIFVFVFGYILMVPLPRGVGILREISYFFY